MSQGHHQINTHISFGIFVKRLVHLIIRNGQQKIQDPWSDGIIVSSMMSKAVDKFIFNLQKFVFDKNINVVGKCRCVIIYV